MIKYWGKYQLLPKSIAEEIESHIGYNNNIINKQFIEGTGKIEFKLNDY